MNLKVCEKFKLILLIQLLIISLQFASGSMAQSGRARI